ncbi:hypothetical protein BKA65DRAFT_475994 [Rhexocercosporidium sp. MPI-PUGE-AT-0058]|nr:hypothetical protein BKA65DRAFT_475994 [Rhexocercosporidium sp. MPI-PUGE-AT-0058]
MSLNLPSFDLSSQSSANSDDNRHELAAQSYISSANSTPPSTFSDLDRWRYHIDFQKFSSDLQAAANAVFPNDTKSRYTKVSVLMLSWANEDPNLPVSQEIDKLYDVFQNQYRYKTDRWTIPDENCHYKLTEKIMDYVKPAEDSKTHLKIVYYAGHARLTETRLLVWTSVRNYIKPKCPIVKWGGIQTILEEATNDVLILLDCCASGTANASEGNGVNELISACAFNETANGVGPFSFTSALVTELRLLGNRPSFSVGELYKKIFFRTQCRMPEELYADGTERERHPAPIHLVLTHGCPVPRSILLPAKVGPQRSTYPTSSWQPPISWGCKSLSSFDSGTPAAANSRNSSVSGPSGNQDSTSTPGTSNTGDPTPDMSQVLKFQRGPRLLFAVRMRDTFQPGEDMVELFTEWMRCMPTIADEVNVEASFDSYSTIVIISLPVSVAAYLPQDPSIISLGPITSENRMMLPEKHQVLRSSIPYSVHHRNNSEPGPRRKSNTNEHPGSFVGDFVPSAQSSLSAILDLLPKVNTSDFPIILDFVETIKRLTGAYDPNVESDTIKISEVRGTPRFAKLGIGYRSSRTIPRSAPKPTTNTPNTSNKAEETTGFSKMSTPPTWDADLRSKSEACYSVGENRGSFQSMTSLNSFETNSSLESQRSSTSTVATRFSHLSDFNPQNSIRLSGAPQRLKEESISPFQSPRDTNLPPNNVQCTIPHCAHTFSDEGSRIHHEKNSHEYKSFSCLLDACTSSCSFPCFQIRHFKPFQTQRWDLLKAHLQKEHPDTKFTLETLPDSWTGKYEHTGSGWNCGDCGRFLGSWKENPSAINRHFENCPVKMERLKELEKDVKSPKTQEGFSISR